MERGSQDSAEGGNTAEKSAIASSSPLIPLQPAQKRQAKELEPGLKGHPSVFKSPRTSEVLKPVARHALNHWLPDPQPGMRARHSAPGDLKESNAELRGSKSAPDLRAPVLAAIRGLQDGSIQVDGRTRAKIAHAARRVLEAREQRRRHRQEAYQSKGFPGHLSPSTMYNQSAQASQQETRQDGSDGAQRLIGESIGATENVKPRQGSASLDLPRANFRRISIDEPQDDILLSRFGDSRSGRTSPFTVTTGVPRFSQGTAFEGPRTPNSPSSLKHARSRSTPVPVVPSVISHASLPRSLDFISGLGETISELSQAAENSKSVPPNST